MATWIDAAEYGLNFFVGVLRPPVDGLPPRVVVATGNIDEHFSSLSALGFVRDAALAYHPTQPDMPALVRAFPRSRILRNIEIKDFARVISSLSAQLSAQQNKVEELAVAQPVADSELSEEDMLRSALRQEPVLDEHGRRIFSFGGKNIALLGLNGLGQETYSLEGRRFILAKDDAGSSRVVWEGAGGDTSVFLRPQSDRQMVRAATGLVLSVTLHGQNVRLSDLRLFAAATQGKTITDPALDLASAATAVERAAAGWLTANPGHNMSEAFARASKIQEALLYRGALGEVGTALANDIVSPALLVAAQRVVGTERDYAGKRLLAVGAVPLFLRSSGLSEISLFSTSDRNEVALNDATYGLNSREGFSHSRWSGVAETKEHDLLFYWGLARTEPVEAKTTADGIEFSRRDFAEVVSLLKQRAPDGRAVIMLSDGTAPNGRAEVERFFSWLARHYAIEGQAEISAPLYMSSSDGPSLTVAAIGMARPEPMLNPPVEALRKVQIERWRDLFAWTNSIVQTRAAIDEYYFNLRAEKEAEQKSAVEEAPSELAPNKFQAPYVSASKIGAASTMVPRNMESATRQALSRLAKKYGDIDAMVSEELQMSTEAMSMAFSPEQVDAIALAIDCQRRGRGFLLADQTGIGKGRVLAALMYRSILSGKKTIFFTEREINITDIWRDFRSIGVDEAVRPFIMNSGARVVDSLTGEILLRGPKRAEIDAAVASGTWPEGDFNLLITTYSQVNRPPPDLERRRRGRAANRTSPKVVWLHSMMEQIGRDIDVFLDESHNPAGNSNIARNVANILAHSHWGVFSSATFAKNTSNLSFYSSLFPPGAIGEAGIEAVLRRGGEPLQEALSAMLSRDGAMARREHDLSKCEFQIVVDEKRTEKHREKTNLLAPVLAELATLSGDVSGIISQHNEKIRAEIMDDIGGEALADDVRMREARRRIASLQINSTAFGSPLYRISRLFAASLLVDRAVEEAVSSLLAGEKPIILLENTSEPVLAELFRNGEVETRPTLKMAILRIIEQITRNGRLLEESVRGATLRYKIEEQIIELCAAKLRGRADEVANALDNDAIDSPALVAAKNELLAAIATSGEEWLSRLGPDLESEEPAVDWHAGPDGDSPSIRMLASSYVEVIAGLNAEVGKISDSEFLKSCFRSPDVMMTPTIERRIKRVLVALDALPDAPLSVIDSLKEGIENKGEELFADGVIPAPWKCGEITGRRLEYREGAIRLRRDTDIMRAKNDFNRGELDVLVINNRGTTGIDLHASETFADQRRRVMIILQRLNDIQRLLQALGRVNRTGQVVGPRILSLLSGIPLETRLVLMENAKLARLSATTTANREHSSKLPAPDMLNSVGDSVVSTYLAMRPELTRRLGLEPSIIDNVAVLGANDAANEANVDNFDKRSANKVLSRLSMLSVEEQEHIYEQLKNEYDAVVQEYNAKGTNPLNSHVIEGKVSERDSWPIGADGEECEQDESDDSYSAFNAPVRAANIVIEHPVLPMGSAEVIKQYERGMVAMQSDDVESYIGDIERGKERYLAGFLPPELSLDDALRGGSRSVIIIKERVERLQKALCDIAAGSLVALSFNGDVAEAIVTRIVPPDRRDTFSPSCYRVMLAIPGSSQIISLSLRTLIDDGEFKVSPGLSGGEADEILARFDAQSAGRRLERRIALVGNEWAAVNYSIDNGGLGTFSQWVGEDGRLQRGIVVAPKKAEALNSMAIPVRSADAAWQVLSTMVFQGRPRHGYIDLFSKSADVIFSRKSTAGGQAQVSVKILTRFLRAHPEVIAAPPLAEARERRENENEHGPLRVNINKEQFAALWPLLRNAGVVMCFEARHSTRIRDAQAAERMRREALAQHGALTQDVEEYIEPEELPNEDPENDQGLGPEPDVGPGQTGGIGGAR